MQRPGAAKGDKREGPGVDALLHCLGADRVGHIAVHDGIAVLSIGSKGIALYDVTNPEDPQEKGVFPIGYSYMSMFWNDQLLVCTREGLQQISIDK